MKRGFLSLERNKGKIKLEILDLLSGAAFPLMLMIILSASIMSFATSDDMTLNVIILSVGEALLCAVLIIFGRQNGVVAYIKTVQQGKKRQMSTTDKKALFGIGEYSLYKGFVIGLIACVPFMLFQIINCILPNSFCEFLLMYAFGWAYLPLSYIHASGWLNLLWVIPALCVHALGYFIGGTLEKKKQDSMAQLQTGKGKNKKDENN